MRGHQEEFSEFVAVHGDGLLRYARLLVPDRAGAEDLLQVALLRLLRHWGKGIASPSAYVRTTLVNLAKDDARRSHLVAQPVADVPGAAAQVSPDLADALVAQAHLDEVLAVLPPRQRLTVVLRIVDGLSEDETAKMLSCSTGTVKS